MIRRAWKIFGNSARPRASFTEVGNTIVRFNWFKWFLYLVIALLTPEVLKVVVTKSQFSAAYLVSIILMCFQTLFLFGFLYCALFVNIFRRRLASRPLWISFAISFICLVALAELLFNYWLYHPAQIPRGLTRSYKYYYDVYNFRILQYEKNIISFDDKLLYRLKSNGRISFSNAEFNTEIVTNSQGFRDDEASAIAPEIICLGDSFTMGWGLDASQSFPEILERRTGMKVLNTGTPSYGTAREFELMDKLDTSNLRYIVIQYCSNDIDENSSFLANKNQLDLAPVTQFKELMRSYELSRKYFPGKNFLLISQLWMKQQLNKIYPLFPLSGQPYTGEFNSNEHALTFFKLLLKFRERFQQVKIIVTNVDINKYRENNFINDLEGLAKTADQDSMKNIIFVNSTSDLNDKDYFILDYHINRSGHEKVASRLIQAIRENPPAH